MADRSSGWAPWYWYVLVLGVVNACAQFFFLSGTDQITNSVVTIVLSVVLMLVVTLVWRLTSKDRAGSRR